MNTASQPQLPVARLQPTKKLVGEFDREVEEVAEPRIELDVEALVRVNDVLEEMMRLAKELAFEAVFNKATQWWDETVKLQQSLFLLYQVCLGVIVGGEKSKNQL